MIVREVMYRPEGQAAMVSNFIRLKLTLEKGGVPLKWETFEGDSKFMDGRSWLMQAEYERVDADTLTVEAFNLEVDSHILSVDGQRFQVPLTGSNQTRMYRFPL